MFDNHTLENNCHKVRLEKVKNSWRNLMLAHDNNENIHTQENTRENCTNILYTHLY